MSDVTVIGLGEMGSALAAAFMRGGRRTTVWNRSGGKAERLILAGALPAEGAAAAVAIFRRAIDAGHGAEEHAAIIKVMRTAA